jgi:hypothetical protein
MRNCGLSRLAFAALAALIFLSAASVGQTTSTPRTPESDRKTLEALEHDWLHARDAATLDRILAPDFVHILPLDHFATRQEHIDWFLKHPPPADRTTTFGKLETRIYGDVGIVNGCVIASDAHDKEVDRTMFTDVFVYRDGKWQAVNAQENRVELPAK